MSTIGLNVGLKLERRKKEGEIMTYVVVRSMSCLRMIKDFNGRHPHHLIILIR